MGSISAFGLPLASCLLLAIYYQKIVTNKQMNKPPLLLPLKVKVKVKEIKTNMPSGLINIGNSCYLSSVIQLLASAETPLIDHFNKCENEISSKLAELLIQVNNGEKRKLKPLEFIESFAGQSLGHHFSPDQQDAHEFLLALLNIKTKHQEKHLDSITLDTDPIKKSLLSSLCPFKGVLMNELICMPCAIKRNPRHVSSIKLEPFSCITLTLTPSTKSTTISEVLYDHFCVPERYSDYCNYKNTIKCGLGAFKQKHPLIFPQLLFLHRSLVKNDQIIKTEIEICGPGYRYKLKSLIVHYGQNGHSGHFICYRRHRDGWIECNDEVVRAVREETVLSQIAYILLYEKDI